MISITRAALPLAAFACLAAAQAGAAVSFVGSGGTATAYADGFIDTHTATGTASSPDPAVAAATGSATGLATSNVWADLTLYAPESGNFELAAFTQSAMFEDLTAYDFAMVYYDFKVDRAFDLALDLEIQPNFSGIPVKTSYLIAKYDGMTLGTPEIGNVDDVDGAFSYTYTALSAGTYRIAFYNVSDANMDGQADLVNGATSASPLSFSTANLQFEINEYADETAAVPEPAAWALMLTGFGLVGGAQRYRRNRTALRLG
jgi:hypothetical protein